MKVDSPVPITYGPTKDTKISNYERGIIDQGVSFVASLTQNINELKFDVEKAPGARASYFDGNMELDIGNLKEDDGSTLAHELGHLLEDRKEGLISKLEAFVEYRCKGEGFTDIGGIAQGVMKGEMGRKNEFDRFFPEIKAYYTGLVYKHEDGSIYGTEILSMGLEALYEDPVGFMQADPEFATFVLGVLRS